MAPKSPPGVIALDGPAGAGKSTVSQTLARRLGGVLLDTGALYRSVAWLAREQGVDWEDEVALEPLAQSLPVRFESAAQGQAQRVLIGGQDVSEAIREPEISQGSSIVSKHPGVRAALLAVQRRLASAGLVVAEGRDIGSVVFPDALVKFYLTADASERARRRHAELVARGQQADLAEVQADMEARDQSDRERAVSPLIQAPDATVVDATTLSAEEVVAQMVAVVEKALAPGGAQDSARSALETRLKDAEARLADREAALPAHTVRPHQLLEVEALEEEVEDLRAQLEARPGGESD